MGRLSTEERDRIVALRQQGHTYARIVEMIGNGSQMSVRRVCIQAGVSENRGRQPNGTTRCGECGIVFPSNPDYSKKTAFCSNECRNAANRRYSHQSGQRFKRHGITRDDFRKLAKAQGGKCAICHEYPGDGGLHVDHDHDTGAVRGLLCGPCNTALGQVGDTMEGLEAFYVSAVAYLGGSS